MLRPNSNLVGPALEGILGRLGADDACGGGGGAEDQNKAASYSEAQGMLTKLIATSTCLGIDKEVVDQLRQWGSNLQQT